MLAKVGRVLRVIVIVLVVVLLAGGLWLGVSLRRSFPQTEGSLQVRGLEAPVEIVRDSFGIPHIYASSEHDLFMAQGFVHAQDRFFQMDFWRHIGSGRLSEMFGDSQLESDKFLRTMGWAHIADEELASADEESRAALEAYSAGVNAYLAQRKGAALSFEYTILGLIARGYQPEPWTPVHTLTWAKVMAYDLGGNMDTEIQRARWLKEFTPDQVADLLPEYPDDQPVIVPRPSTGSTFPAQSGTAFAAVSLPDLTPLAQRMADVHALTRSGFDEIGSNNWVIGGSRTTTGKPILADDMHLGIQMPSIWYEVGLHCKPSSEGCRLNVTGYSFAGVPGVIVGHNDSIAWGVTNAGPDVQDLFLEKINPANPNQYEFNGEWVDMEIVEEVIQVAGGDPLTLAVRRTRHGPILSDVMEDAAKLDETSSLDLPSPFAVSLRWTALEPTHIVQAVILLNRASNWQEFRAALQNWDVPAQNFVYADVEGNIGYQMPGRIPIRASGDGAVPAPGWNGEGEWTSTIPFEELPFAFNPAQGYIATANNAIVGSDYPYLISREWDYGFRARRIVEMIEATPKLSIEDIQRIHGDNLNAIAPILVPLLREIDLGAELTDRARLLDGWDFQNSMDSPQAALFNAFWNHLVLRTFRDDLPDGPLPNGAWGFEVFRQFVRDPASAWWDDRRTPETEGREEIFRLAFSDAVADLEKRLGRNPASWSWGALHSSTFESPLGIGPLGLIFNRGPFATAGGSGSVNNTGWAIGEDYSLRGLPSQRMIVDLSDLSKSLSVITTGQSGHAFHPHYIDMADLWRNVQYHPMLWTEEQVRVDGEAHLTLTP